MFFFAHLGLPLILSDLLMKLVPKNATPMDPILPRWTDQRLILLPFIFGSFLPDILDKIINQPLMGSGRAYGHTLMFVGIFSCVMLLIFGIPMSALSIPVDQYVFEPDPYGLHVINLIIDLNSRGTLSQMLSLISAL